jgi:hypothetical protein
LMQLQETIDFVGLLLKAKTNKFVCLCFYAF